MFLMQQLARIAQIFLLTTVAVAASGCHFADAEVDADANDEMLLSTSESAMLADPALRDRVIAFAKHRIREISLANQTRTDNRAQVTNELRPFIDLLVLAAPRLSQAETLQRLQGPWYSLWTNQEFRGNTPNLARIFQVIFPGHFYNISDSPAPGGGTVIGALRGAYAPIPDALAIRFVRNAFVPGTLVGKTAAEVNNLAAAIESGSTPSIPLPGPIGITGQLGAIYVDDTLRISSGLQTPVFDDVGTVTVPGEFGLLFILERLSGTVQ
jgi:hypothetical protein